MDDIAAPEGAPVTLRRVIGLAGLTLLGLNFIIGAGVFGLPGLVAEILGPAALIAYLMVAAMMVLIGLCLAEAGSRVTGSGGLYAYAEAAFGPVVGGIAGTLLWLTNAVAPGAALANLWVDTAGSFVPALGGAVARRLIFLILYALLAFINVRGTRQGTRLSGLIAAIKLAPLLLIFAIGLFTVHSNNLGWGATPPPARLGEACVLVFFSFMGMEGALTASGEVTRPARTVPIAIVLALGSTAILYIGLQEISQGLLGPRLAGSASPLIAVAAALLGPWGGRMVAIAVLLSLTGYLAADMVVSPRVLHAMAERRQLPRLLAAVHPRFRTPAVAICAYAIACALVACTGTFRQLVVLASAGTLVLYLITCLAVLRLRALGIATGGEPFRAPAGPFVPLAAAAAILGLLSTLSWMEIGAISAMIIVSGGIYALQQRGLRVPAIAG